MDFFETMFWALSRQEECNSDELDEYMRYPARPSDAYKRGYLDRPIVDEYMEVLWAYIKRIWPCATRSRRKGSIRYSCDVDTPFDPAASGLAEFTKRFAADLIIRKNPRLALQRCCNAWRISKGQIEQDPNYQFSFILEQLESHNTTATFYFLSTLAMGKGQGWYVINDPKIRSLIKALANAGHEIGLHGSFGSYASPEQYHSELKLICQIIQDIGIKAPIIRNRQHFLQFDMQMTPDVLAASDMHRDSSGGYADHAGFRFGTAIPFPMWSWQQSKALPLIQEPLICMECSLLSSKYMNLPHYPEAFEHASTLKKRALAYGGDFTLLWHNSEFKTAQDRNLFCDLLRTD